MENIYPVGDNIKFEVGEKHMDTRRSNYVPELKQFVCCLLFQTAWSEHQAFILDEVVVLLCMI